jgi:hypothetical protein
MSKPSRVIVVLENDHHQKLLYRYLIECGWKRRQIYIPPPPSGQGSAESWVRQRFVKETNAYRNRQARAQTALIVMIDADTFTVPERLNQLDQALRDNGQKTVGKNERIARLVPRLNVETWILCLNGEQDVDEDTDYKRERRNWHEMIPPAAEMLCQWTRPNAEPPNRWVDSLRIGVRELKPLRS